MIVLLAFLMLLGGNLALAQEGQTKGSASGSAEAKLPSGSRDTKASIGANVITLGKNPSFAGQSSAGFFQQLSREVDALYKYSIGIAGLLAFGILVYAGMVYIFSAGGFAKQDEAKKWIMAAITGLVLLLCAVLVLNFLPEVTKIRDVAPPVSPPKQSSSPSATPPKNSYAIAQQHTQSVYLDQLKSDQQLQTNTKNSVIVKFQKLPPQVKEGIISFYQDIEKRLKTELTQKLRSDIAAFSTELKGLVGLNDVELLYVGNFIPNSQEFIKMVRGS